VVANSGSGSATVLIGKGDGTFAAGANYPTVGADPTAVAIGDWTSDGKLDFIAGDTLFAGRADGTFAHGVTYGYSPYSLVSADFDHDGHLDLVASEGTTAYFLSGRGDGTFGRKGSLDLGESPFSLTMGDLNGDREPDLVVVGPYPAHAIPTAVYVLIGGGDGTFHATQSADRQLYAVDVGIGDVDGDGKVDLQFGLQETWFGHGDGTFTRFAPGTPNDEDVLVGFADWDGDGRPEVAVHDAADVLKVIRGNGKGTFGLLPFYPLPSATFVGALADLNGDGRLDLITGSTNNGSGPSVLTILQGNGDGTFAAQPPIPLGTEAFTFTAADVNRDGRSDLVFSGSGVSVMLGTGNGAFGPAIVTPSSGTIQALGDVDGDGLLDVVVFQDDPSVQRSILATMFGAGDGTFGAPVLTDPGVDPIGNVMFADLDGDGRMDAVLPAGDPASPVLRLLFGSADRSFTLEDQSVPAPARPLAAGDLDGDGQPDLVGVFPDAPGAVVVYRGTGSRTFAPRSTYTASNGFVAGEGQATLADLNGDGALDLVAPGGGLVLLGRGDGTFTCDQAVATDFYGPVFVGDLNQDGRADLLTISGDETTPAATPLLAR
jgi:FG-GAP-like repeat